MQVDAIILKGEDDLRRASVGGLDRHRVRPVVQIKTSVDVMPPLPCLLEDRVDAS
jgi:hypothetical protein